MKKLSSEDEVLLETLATDMGRIAVADELSDEAWRESLVEGINEDFSHLDSASKGEVYSSVIAKVLDGYYDDEETPEF